MAEGIAGKPWSEEEVEVALEIYFRMFLWQLDGIEFAKKDVSSDVAAQLPARSRKSIELKWCNVSAVLDELGLAWVNGYRPMPNYQRSLKPAVEVWLEGRPEVSVRLGY